MTNFRNLQYYGPLYLGSQRQKLNFVYDTGSSWLWFPKQTCKGCPTNKGYDITRSSFFLETEEVKELFYGKGYVSGKIVYDNVALMSMEVESIPLKMLAVDVAEDLEGTQADGILGLSPEPTTGSESFVKKMAENGVIDASQFTVFIGSAEESSYIDFGKYKGDTINTTWVDIINPNYWSVIFNSFSYKNKDISLPSRVAVLDTGTSILGFPRGDLANIIAAVREERQLYYLEDINFYAVQ